MSERCHNCPNDVPGFADYCPFCGSAFSESAQKKEKKVKCLNKKCIASNPLNANYCSVCGYALSDFAKKTQKDNRGRGRRKQKNELLGQTLPESNSESTEQKNKMLEINKQLLDANIKIKKLEEREVTHIIPIWVYIIFSIIGGVFLIILLSSIK